MSTFELDALWKSTDAGPVTLLNLVKYRDRSNDGQGTGREAYTRHTDVARGLVESREAPDPVVTDAVAGVAAGYPVIYLVNR